MGTKTSKEDRIKIADEAIAAKEGGTAYVKISKKYNIGYHTLINWVKLRKKGGLKEESDIKKEDISPGLMSELSKNFNGISDSKQVKYIVFAGDLQDKNFLSVSIEEPEISDPVEKELETMKRILAEVEWFPVFKGFKFPKGGKEDGSS